MQGKNVISPLFLLCNAVHHSKVSDEEKCTLVNKTKWQYYGTPNTGGNLTLTWTHQTLEATHVNIEVWGYQETGKVTLFPPVHKHLSHMYLMCRALHSLWSLSLRPQEETCRYTELIMSAFPLHLRMGGDIQFQSCGNCSFPASKTIFFLCLTGDSYSENWTAEWKYLYTLARGIPNTGTFSFIPVPAVGNYNTWDFGVLRIIPSNYFDGQRQVHHNIH